MQTLILNCSPVRDGATATLAHYVAEALQADGPVQERCLDDYEIRYCRGCRACHTTAACPIQDGAPRLLADWEAAQRLVLVVPSYWGDVPGQFKAFIDRCTPYSNTHEPHARLSPGKTVSAVVLRTGPGEAECLHIVDTLRHFLGHLDLPLGEYLTLCDVADREAAIARRAEVMAFASGLRRAGPPPCGGAHGLLD